MPLALTWALCAWQDKSEYRQFGNKHAYCISTVDSACYVADRDFLEFYVACSEQNLFLDQGIVGKSFATKTQCFATDVTSFSKTNYPLSHHARMFNLRAAMAIPLRSIYTGLVDIVLELFLPNDCQDIEEQKRMWDLLPIVIQQACQSLHVVMDKQLMEEINRQKVVARDRKVNEEGNQKSVSSSLKEPSKEESFLIPHIMDAQEKGKYFYVSWDCPKEEPEEEFKVITGWDTNESDLYYEQGFSDFGFPEFGQLQQNSKTSVEVDGDCSADHHRSLGSRKAGMKRQTKTEKTISLQVLQQYFAGSLKDAAKSIGGGKTCYYNKITDSLLFICFFLVIKN